MYAIRVAAALLVVLGAVPHDLRALSLAWDPSPSEGVAGYELLVGYAPGEYDYAIDVGPRVEWPMPALAAGRTHYFAVSAYDELGRRSAPSNEVAFLGDAVDAQVPTARIAVAPKTGPAPLLVRLSVQADGGIASYRWDFGDGSSLVSNAIASIAGVAHEYAEPGAYLVRFSASGPAGSAISLQSSPVIVTPTDGCPCTLFGAATPRIADSGPGKPMTVGLRFKVLADGFITGLRIYRSADNREATVGHLWSRDGRLLASAELAAASRAGWQSTALGQPVAVRQGELLVASYHSPRGHHAHDEGALSRGFTNGPLQVLPYRAGTGNGVQAAGDASSFPDESARAAYFGVDVVFVPSGRSSGPSRSRNQPATQKTRGGASSQPDATPRMPATMSRTSK